MVSSEPLPSGPRSGPRTRCRPLLSRVPRVGSPTSQLLLRHSDFPPPRLAHLRSLSGSVLRRRGRDLPSSSATLATHAPDFDPGGADEADLRGGPPLRFASPMLPSTPSSASASTTSPFRDSIPRPACSLSTLRGHGCPSLLTTTQDSLPAGGPPWLGGIPTRWVAHQVSSRVWFHMIPPERGLLGAQRGQG